MKTLDIDLYDPGYWDVKKLRRKPKQWEVRSGWIHTQFTSSRNRVGVRPEKMRDWRSLERRMSEIHTAWRIVSDAFWSMSRTFPRPSTPRSKNGWYKVIVSVEDGGGKVLKFSEGGYSIDWSDYLLKELTKDPDCYGDFTFVPYDGGGRELSRLEHRKDRLMRAYGVYRAAFQKAATDRLMKVRESQKIPHTRYDYEPAVFLIENEGRFYVVTSGTGGFTWHEGDVHHVS